MAKNERGESEALSCLGFVLAVALILLLIKVWDPLVGFVTRWLETH
jgi:hypothetical protein